MGGEKIIMKKLKTPSKKTGSKRRFFFILTVCFALFISVYGYYKYAFPNTECEYSVEHLKSPESLSDCYTCHIKATPKVAQNWYESKHGIMLVKCFVCHGQPDGNGSIPYAVKPDVDFTCRKCHEPSIKTMEEKYGLEPVCNDCHSFHSNSLHHVAYVKPETKKTID